MFKKISLTTGLFLGALNSIGLSTGIASPSNASPDIASSNIAPKNVDRLSALYNNGFSEVLKWLDPKSILAVSRGSNGLHKKVLPQYVAQSLLNDTQLVEKFRWSLAAIDSRYQDYFIQNIDRSTNHLSKLDLIKVIEIQKEIDLQTLNLVWSYPLLRKEAVYVAFLRGLQRLATQSKPMSRLQKEMDNKEELEDGEEPKEEERTEKEIYSKEREEAKKHLSFASEDSLARMNNAQNLLYHFNSAVFVGRPTEYPGQALKAFIIENVASGLLNYILSIKSFKFDFRSWQSGSSLMHLAIKSDDYESVTSLIEEKRIGVSADDDYDKNLGRTPSDVKIAAIHSSPQMLDLILKYVLACPSSSLLSLQDDRYWADILLESALKNRDPVSMIQVLIQNRLKWSHRIFSDKGTLKKLPQNTNEEKLQFQKIITMIRQNSDQDIFGMTPHQSAILPDFVKSSVGLIDSDETMDHIDWLIQNGVDPNQKDSDGNTALHYLLSDHERVEYVPDLISPLLNAKANVNAQNALGKTALHQAIFSTKIKLSDDYLDDRSDNISILEKVISKLAPYGLDLKVQDQDGMSVFHEYLVEYFTFSMLPGDPEGESNMELERDYERDYERYRLEPNLQRRLHMTTLFVKLGSDLNSQNRWKQTPLHIAGLAHDSEYFWTLVSMGADRTIRDQFGKTAEDYLNTKDLSPLSEQQPEGSSERVAVQYPPYFRGVIKRSGSILRECMRMPTSLWFGR